MRQYEVCCLDANFGATADTDESSTSNFRNTLVLFSTSQGDDIHRKKAPSVLRGETDLARSDIGIDKH
jgi:hypothetical protein